MVHALLFQRSRRRLVSWFAAVPDRQNVVVRAIFTVTTQSLLRICRTVADRWRICQLHSVAENV